jgi:hypothetical protein
MFLQHVYNFKSINFNLKNKNYLKQFLSIGLVMVLDELSSNEM